MKVPMTPERMIVRQYWKTSRKRRHHPVVDRDDPRLGVPLHHAEDLGEAEGADHRRDQVDAAAERAACRR